MSGHLNSSTTTQLAKIMAQCRRPNPVGRKFPIGNAYSWRMKTGPASHGRAQLKSKPTSDLGLSSPCKRTLYGQTTETVLLSRVEKNGTQCWRSCSANNGCERDMMRENDEQFFWGTHYFPHLGLAAQSWVTSQKMLRVRCTVYTLRTQAPLCGSCHARVSATLQVFTQRVILDGAACRLGEHGDVHDVLGVLGDDHVVPVVLRVLVSWYKEEWMREMMCSRWTASERTTKGWDMGHTRWQHLFWRTKMTLQSVWLEPSAWCAFHACEQTVLNRCVLWVGVLSAAPRRFSGILSNWPKSSPFIRWCRLPRAPNRFPLWSWPLRSWRWRCCLWVSQLLSVVRHPVLRST